MTTLYQKQINHIFNRPDTEPAWYWSNHWEEGIFEGEENPIGAFTLIETLLQNPKADLSPYSNNQIALGLEYIFNGSISDLSSAFKVADVSYQRKEAAVRSLFVLFRDIFNPLCKPETSSFSRITVSKLNNICYMFWDVTDLATWRKFTNTEEPSFWTLSDVDFDKAMEDYTKDIQQQYQNLDKETEGLYRAVASVMEQCLSLSNPACVESGLHGLGHMATFQSNIAVPIIDKFINNAKKRHNNLMEYAKMARTGMIP
ncbi:hypothetical protein C7N43_37280 [Sphingobacteriales bacterium UPWRP_1]|nr:hypothetical protein C7N43_37280 [Sphingobacteriales bacterium UPWRP_1]